MAVLPALQSNQSPPPGHWGQGPKDKGSGQAPYPYPSHVCRLRVTGTETPRSPVAYQARHGGRGPPWKGNGRAGKVFPVARPLCLSASVQSWRQAPSRGRSAGAKPQGEVPGKERRKRRPGEGQVEKVKTVIGRCQFGPRRSFQAGPPVESAAAAVLPKGGPRRLCLPKLAWWIERVQAALGWPCLALLWRYAPNGLTRGSGSKPRDYPRPIRQCRAAPGMSPINSRVRPRNPWGRA